MEYFSIFPALAVLGLVIKSVKDFFGLHEEDISYYYDHYDRID